MHIKYKKGQFLYEKYGSCPFSCYIEGLQAVKIPSSQCGKEGKLNCVWCFT